MSGEIIKIYYEELPKNGSQIDWNKAINCNVKFQCIDIVGEFKILSVDKDGKKIKNINVKYNDHIISIPYSSFLCNNIRKIFYPYKYRYKIGQHIKDKKRDLTITGVKLEKERKYNRYIKIYSYHCNKCSYDGSMNESNLSRAGCPCCSNTIVVPGINDICTTDPWMIKYFQGGEKEAKLYTSGSTKRIYPICPDCGRVKDKTVQIGTICKTHSIGCKCSDGVSYPEKFFISLLDQLNIKYIWQLSKNNFEWCEKYKYDFYLIDYNYIIELHGEQHYRTANFPTTKEKQNKIDKIKKDIGSRYVDKYIIIDCRYSDLNWIKNNIENSELSKILNFKNVNYNLCEEFACKNIIKEICTCYNKNKSISTNELSKIYKVDISTIIRYLHKGNNAGWCTYNAKENMLKGTKAAGESNKKYVEIYKNDNLINSYSSLQNMEEKSLNDLGIKLSASYAAQCYKNNKPYKGYTFKIYKNGILL